MKLRDLLKKLRRRSPQKRSSDSVDKAFTDSYERAGSSWMPSQQDRPPH